MSSRSHNASRKKTAPEHLNDVIAALRAVWAGGPEAGSALIRALDGLRAITPAAAATNAAAVVVDEAIATLRHLPADVPTRRAAVQRTAESLKAIGPVLGQPTHPEHEIGKLNTALGEKRTGHVVPERAPRRVRDVGSEVPQAPITAVPGLGGRNARPFEEKLGLHTLQDVLEYIPRRHIDYTRTIRLSDPIAIEGEAVIRGTLARVQQSYGRPPRLTATLNDGTGSLAITWFSTYIARQLTDGLEIVVAGKIERSYGGLKMTNPEWEIVGWGGVLTQERLIPVYKLTAGVTQKRMRSITRMVLDMTAGQIVDWLSDARLYIDDDVWDYLPALATMYENIHYPRTMDDFILARKRMQFENLLLLQIGMVQRRMLTKAAAGIPIPSTPEGLAAVVDVLPFRLTGAQERVVHEVLADMARPEPMTRLVQGDVGSGKTVVAAIATKIANDAGMQTAIMAPTELLAEQHASGVERLFAPLPEERRPRLALLTGSTRAAARREILAQLSAGEIDVIVGTHALLTDDVSFCQLGLVVIDEQHRFGVVQRQTLAEKALGYQPHMLSMTATPIPRTLNIVLHGDLDVSIINERPPGRIPIETRAYLGDDRVLAYDLARREVEAGHQVFVICPLVEESESSDTRAAVNEAERLQTEVFPDMRVDVLHGKMRAKQKDEVMERFRNREFDILVSTSVIEVGIDIPNATVMIIEGAEGFGLAQLHQFRGRVGRGGDKSWCLLLSDTASPDDNKRLQAMVETDDGFVLAERDLELRGPGDMIGTRQSGLPNLGFLEFGFDSRMLDRARASAERLVAAEPDIPEERFMRLKPRLAAFWARRELVSPGAS